MIDLTQEEKDILAYEIIDPEYWVNVEDSSIGKKKVPREHLDERLNRLQEPYERARYSDYPTNTILNPNYKTRAEREIDLQNEDGAIAENKKRYVKFEKFESRFTTQEWDNATDFVYEVNTSTGKPKRKALVQGLSRAMARGYVDLLRPKTIAFMDALVAGNIITELRKTEILTP